MLDDLFKFPSISVDNEAQAKKEEMDALLGQQSDPECVVIEVEQPYFHFISISDRWLFSQESYEKAKQGIFDASLVVFETGSYLVPWTKEKFKFEFKSFLKTKRGTGRKKKETLTPNTENNGTGDTGARDK